MSQLVEAIYRGELEAVRRLLSGGEDPNVRDEDGRTALMLVVLSERGSPEMLAALLEGGASVDARDSGQGWTALHFAAQAWKEEYVRTLLRSGASVDVVDVFGNSPLWRAVFSSRGRTDVVRVLVEGGADPDKTNKHGVSPRSLAETIEGCNAGEAF